MDELTVAEDSDIGSLRYTAEGRTEEGIPGYYGEVQVEYYFNERTGFFAGATYENLGDFEQTLGTRESRTDLGAGPGFKFGIVTRF